MDYLMSLAKKCLAMRRSIIIFQARPIENEAGEF